MPVQRTTRRPAVDAVCQQCGAAFRLKAAEAARGRGTYCSAACYHAARKVNPLPPLATRFWPKVNKTATCWLWTGARQGGYGEMSAGRRGEQPLRAHRVSWEIHNGPIPSGMFVLHNCADGDNPLCVNPEHLFLGDAKANAQDMTSKGRHWRQRKK